MAVVRPGVITNWDAAEEQIIFYRKHLDIFIEDACAPVKLSPTQHVLIRQIGNCVNSNDTCSRGYGKTFVAALAGFAVGVLYPGSKILIVSATAAQATLVLTTLKSIADQNPNIANEINATNARSLIQISKNGSQCTLKNGSVLRSLALESVRGQRAKLVIVDEALDVDQDKLEAIVAPTRNEIRYNARTFGFKDFQSKTVTITSACAKNNQYYSNFLETVKRMAKGDRTQFACALDYKTAIADGINDAQFFEGEKARMPDIIFQMEYGCKFLGSENNSAFPYELTQSCRTLKKIELEQPKNSKSRYVISLDIATSEAKDADNSIITVIKFTERADGSYAKKVVLIRSFHGKTLDVLAEELRQLYHVKFPNTEKIIYDARGLGDSLDRFFDKEWVDSVSGKEYPPLVVDDSPNMNAAALPVLHPFRAVQTLNQRIYTNLRVALEKRTIELPVDSRIIKASEAELEDPSQQMRMEEKAIFHEADALQFEMGNIVSKVGASGNVLYDTPRNSMHKDRYSSLAMGNDYISELEKDNIKKYQRGKPCVGIATYF